MTGVWVWVWDVVGIEIAGMIPLFAHIFFTLAQCLLSSILHIDTGKTPATAATVVTIIAATVELRLLWSQALH
jgi:hypothetical protein